MKKKTQAVPPRAGFQGEFGAFSQQAAEKLLGEQAQTTPFPSFTAVFDALQAGDLQYAVIPMENTLHGSVHENYDHLLRYGCRILAETTIRINHNLMAPPGVSFKQVRKVYSHPVALNQCLDFFREHPELEKAPHYDTAGSARMIMAEGKGESAAIASARAAEIYGARILKRSIEDDRQNFTRFFLLGDERAEKPLPPTGKANEGRKPVAWKTSVVFSVPNTPGSLFRCMSAFALRDLSLTKVESRPLRGKPFDYLFYLDFLGRVGETATDNAIRHLTELADMLKVLGSYPRGDV
ncbi:MAG: prephenate dehydratase [Bryobacterales bacterium]|jgi:prephenate dehydratase|nr:prephenate dehydratase [Bryobacterales bacterium]